MKKYQKGAYELEGLCFAVVLVMAFWGVYFSFSENATTKSRLIDICKAAGQFQHEKIIVKCQVIEPGVK